MDWSKTTHAILIVTIICICCWHTARANKNVTLASLDPFANLTKGYNKKLRPNFNGPAVKVIASAYIVAVDNVNDVKSDFTVKMYFSQYWNDSRLAFGDNIEALRHKTDIRVAGDDMNDIWKPDTYVENEENIGTHKIFSSVKITNHGQVHMSQRLTVKANCPTMNLKLFPHDVQICNLLQTSYAFPNTELTYDWKSENAVIVGESSIATQYILEKTYTNIEDVYFKASRCLLLILQEEHFENDSHVVQIKFRFPSCLNTGSKNATWTYLKTKFVLRRKIAYYVIRIYLPAILVTITSWISFWVDPTAIPARLSLCVITVLAMTTLSYSSQSMVPSVPYVKAVDIYLIISFFFVFGSLLEYAILLNRKLRCARFIGHKQEEKAEEILLTKNGQDTEGVTITEVENGCSGKERKDVKKPNGKNDYFSTWTIDKFSAVLFPAAYVIFHMIFYAVILA